MIIHGKGESKAETPLGPEAAVVCSRSRLTLRLCLPGLVKPGSALLRSAAEPKKADLSGLTIPLASVPRLNTTRAPAAGRF